jgi:uncharacterized protein
MWLTEPLDSLLSSRAKVRLLRVLAQARVPLTGREISRRARLGAGTGSRLLRELAAAGVVEELDQGSAHTYSLNSDAPLVPRLRELFEAESERLRAAVRELHRALPDLISVVLFGSEARGEAQAASDTDLLLVVERAPRNEVRVNEACLALAEKYALSLSWHVVDPPTLKKWDRTGNDLWANLLSEGVLLWGGSLERLRESWQTGKAA